MAAPSLLSRQFTSLHTTLSVHQGKDLMFCRQHDAAAGRTARAAGLIAGRLRETGAVVRAVPLGQIGVDELTATDLLVFGTWIQGFAVAGVGPARAAGDWLASLPRLPGLPTATFCTYSISPRRTLPAIRTALEHRGLVIVAEGSFGPRTRDIAPAAAEFTAQLLAAAWPSKIPDRASPA